jgi:hypothetical protein
MTAAMATVVRLRVTRASHLTPTALVVVWVMLLALQNQARVSSAHHHVRSAVCTCTAATVSGCKASNCSEGGLSRRP